MCDEPKVEKYSGWFWADEIQYDVVCSFWPSKERKILITVVSGRNKDMKFLQNYFMDELNDVLRPSDTAWDSLPPSTTTREDVLRSVPTLLPCCEDSLDHIEWTLTNPHQTMTLREWKFVGLVRGSEHYEAIDCSKNSSTVHRVKLELHQPTALVFVDFSQETPGDDKKVFAFDRIFAKGEVFGCSKVRPQQISQGANPISWIVTHRLKDWYSLIPPGCLVTTDNRTNVLNAALQSYNKAESDSERQELVLFLTTIGTIVTEHAGEPLYRPATDTPSPAYHAISVEPDVVAVKRFFLLTRLIIEGDVSADVQHRENILLSVLHNACAVGRRRIVERVIQFLKVFAEWNNGSLLSRALLVSKGGKRIEQYAVSVAASYGHVDVLQLLRHFEVDMMAGDGLALRRAIQHKQFETADWIVKNCWSGQLTVYPSLEEIHDLGVPVSQEELKFCHDHNLLNTAYDEEYICCCTTYLLNLFFALRHFPYDVVQMQRIKKKKRNGSLILVARCCNSIRSVVVLSSARYCIALPRRPGTVLHHGVYCHDQHAMLRHCADGQQSFRLHPSRTHMHRDERSLHSDGPAELPNLELAVHWLHESHRDDVRRHKRKRQTHL
jgi:hypothetical protein